MAQVRNIDARVKEYLPGLTGMRFVSIGQTETTDQDGTPVGMVTQAQRVLNGK
ncbi:MAG: hypothetical protein ABIL58_10615 [Pseudomonadota bacterium]